MEKDKNIRVEITPADRKSYICASYIVKDSNDIACIFLMPTKNLEVEVSKSKDHPSILAFIRNSKGGPFEISFIDYDNNWTVFSVATEENGVKVTLIKLR